MRPNRIDEEYLAWIRRHNCAGPALGGQCCSAPTIEPHHVTGRGMGGSKRDDRDTVPLCVSHHRELHDTGAIKPWSVEETKGFLRDDMHKLLKGYLDAT